MNKKYNKILHTTINLFIEYGVKKTTMDEIAERANVSKVTIYKYFGDKDALYFEAGKSILTYYANRLTGVATTEEPIEARLKTVMDVLTDFIASGKLSLSKVLSKFNPDLEERYDAFKCKYKHVLLSLIDEGKQSGIIRNDIKSDYLYHYIDMGICYFQNDDGYREKMINDQRFKEEFMHYVLQNIFIDTVDF